VGEVSYKGHRYPAEIIAHCAWLYHRFPLSFLEVVLLVRGMIDSYEIIRQGIVKLLSVCGGCQGWSVASAAKYKGYRYPIEVIGHVVWLYHRFALSLRDVEECCLPAVWWSATRRSGPGLPRSDRTTPTSCVGGEPAPATSGTSTRCSSGIVKLFENACGAVHVSGGDSRNDGAEGRQAQPS
jgi:hypothetical protein